MPELPDIVKRAASVHEAIAGDLTIFGGILRCGKCGTEQPLDAADIAAYLRHGWPQHCGYTMTWVTQKLLAAEKRDVPAGYELTSAESGGWRLQSGKRCRAGAGFHHPACGASSVAELNRSTEAYPRWFAYCPRHMYGNWIENGLVMHWILREKDNAGA